MYQIYPHPMMMTSYNDFFIHTILLIIWVGYAMIEGRQEAHLYHYRNIVSPKKKKDLHWMPFVERGIFLILIGYCSYTESGPNFPILKSGVFIASLVLIFSFFYDGVYYCMTHKLDRTKYVKKWWASSDTSEAGLEFSCTARIVMAFTGMMGIIASVGL